VGRARFAFDSRLRLKTGWEFDTVFRTGRQQRGELVRVYFVKGGQAADKDDRPRVGVTVGKKIAGAALRSRGRRMLREAARRLMPWVKNEVWFVLSLRERGLASDAAAVYGDAARQLSCAGLLRDDWSGVDWSVDERPLS
jgi:ribonuclease P protein component